MSDLYKALIRLGEISPDLRSDITPILDTVKQAAPVYFDSMDDFFNMEIPEKSDKELAREAVEEELHYRLRGDFERYLNLRIKEKTRGRFFDPDYPRGKEISVPLISDKLIREHKKKDLPIDLPTHAVFKMVDFHNVQGTLTNARGKAMFSHEGDWYFEVVPALKNWMLRRGLK